MPPRQIGIVHITVAVIAIIAHHLGFLALQPCILPSDSLLKGQSFIAQADLMVIVGIGTVGWISQHEDNLDIGECLPHSAGDFGVKEIAWASFPCDGRKMAIALCIKAGPIQDGPSQDVVEKRRCTT